MDIQSFKIGAPLPFWQRWLNAIVRFFYFNSVRMYDTSGHKVRPYTFKHFPVLLYVSHRNGRIDDCMLQKLHPYAVNMVPIRIMRHPLFKWFFSGIPVMGSTEAKQMGEKAINPMRTAIRHIQKKGAVCYYPEGRSQWGYQPQPYHRGGAKIISTLLSKKHFCDLRVVGVFYTDPDEFRSNVELIVSEPIHISPRQAHEKFSEWESRIFAQINAELDSISVNCRDEIHFAAVRQYAQYLYETEGGSYGLHFINAQRQKTLPLPEELPKVVPSYINYFSRFMVGIFTLLMAPVLFIGHHAEKKANAKNPAVFLRVTKGTTALIIWVLILLSIALYWPPISLLYVMALVGLLLYDKTKNNH